jgi:hypothetical protein
MIDVAVQNAYSLARLKNKGKTESRETWNEELGFLFINLLAVSFYLTQFTK